MGVRTLVGEADGTTHAAAMYCSTSGQMIGDLWEAPDAEDQIQAFLDWLRPTAHRIHDVVEGLHGPLLTHAAAGADVRDWSDGDLQLLVAHWRAENVGEDGWLLDPYECACGDGHHHLGEHGETVRHGECVYEKHAHNPCGCTTWRPGNKAAERAAEGD